MGGIILMEYIYKDGVAVGEMDENGATIPYVATLTASNKTRVVAENDVEFNNAFRGVIFADEANAKWIVSVDGNGNLVTTKIASSPEVDFSARQQLVTANRTLLAAAETEIALTAAQVTAVKNYFSADVDTLFASLTVAQRTFLKVQHRLVRYIAKKLLLGKLS